MEMMGYSNQNVNKKTTLEAKMFNLFQRKILQNI